MLKHIRLSPPPSSTSLKREGGLTWLPHMSQRMRIGLTKLGPSCPPGGGELEPGEAVPLSLAVDTAEWQQLIIRHLGMVQR